jgi:hypothetical protein
MADTLGLLEEARHLARDLGYEVREEPLGDLPGGPCTLSGRRQILLNVQHHPADQAAVLIRALAADPRVASQPKSRLLADRLAAEPG